MQENKDDMWTGSKNKYIRWYFYSQRGLALFNEFRYLLMLIFGAYVVLKLKDPVWMAVMFAAALPVLVIFGWFQVNHMAKVINFLDIHYGSYWSKRSLEWQERQLKAVESINEKMEYPQRVSQDIALTLPHIKHECELVSVINPYSMNGPAEAVCRICGRRPSPTGKTE